MTDIYDIKPPLPLDQGVGWAALALLGLGLLLAGLLGWHLRRTAPQRRQRRALRHAWRRLQAEAAGLDDRDFYFRLAAVLRRGLARRTGLATQAMTTEELLPVLEASELPDTLRQAVAAVLGRADPARYADPDQAGGRTNATLRRADLTTTRAIVWGRERR